MCVCDECMCEYRRMEQVVSGAHVCVMSACVSTGGRSRWLVGLMCVMSACVSVCMVNCRWSRLVSDITAIEL